MKSLAERHIDRAQRKVDNEAESTENKSGGTLGAAALAVAAAQTALAALTPEQREELKASMEGFESETEVDNLALAGIGTVNSAVVSGAEFAKMAATPVQNGELPEASFDPANGNLNGQAVEVATEAAGWAATPVVEEKAEEEKPAKVK